MLFATWKYKGKQFLALGIGGRYVVVDEDRQHYGSWMDYRTFRAHQKVEPKGQYAQPIGTVEKFGVYTAQ